MSPTDLQEDLRKRPFEPHRLYVLDGTMYDIRHPEQCMVGIFSSVIGVDPDPNTLVFKRLIRIDNNHIHKVEPIHGIPITTNGKQPS
jgi:hypothetical protein